MNLDIPSLSIGGLSAETGISVPTLRAWERRHGLPVAVRLPSGHRRYSQRDVETINEIQRRRLSGSSLTAAIDAVRARSEVPRSSIMRTVQHFVDDVPPVRLSKSMLVAISRAIEDEAAAWADQPVLVGAFQSDEFLRQSHARWDDLSRTSIATIVFAGPQTKRDRRKAAGNPPWIVPVGTGEPLVREWAVICDSARFCACLVATERLPAKPGTRTRYYEAIWTVAPIAVREATRTALSLAEAHHPTLGHLLADTLDQQPAPDAEAARTATILINRIAAELDRIGPARE